MTRGKEHYMKKQLERGTEEYRLALYYHMARAEMEFIADNGGGKFPPFENQPPEIIEQLLRTMKLKLRKKDEFDIDWITTTSGININLCDGFIIRIK